jgi:hypothetical protein
MNELEFEDWCRQQQLAKHTIDLIAQIRKSPPSRRVLRKIQVYILQHSYLTQS